MRQGPKTELRHVGTEGADREGRLGKEGAAGEVLEHKTTRGHMTASEAMG